MELLLVCLLIAVVSGMAVPQLLAGLSRSRTLAAARYLAGRLQGARTQAASKGQYVGLRVTVRGVDVLVAGFRDGNHNGMRLTEMTGGVDPLVDAEVAIGALFPYVQAGAPSGAVPTPLTSDDVTVFSFAPTGTASSGTVYLRSRDDGQYAVRVLGATGRVRVLRFRPAMGDWVDVR